MSRHPDLLDLLSLAVLALGSDGRVTFANEGWTQLVGLPREAAADDGWLDVFLPEEREYVRLLVATGLEERRRVVTDVAAETGLGRRVLRLDARPQLSRTGGLERFVLSLLDVTEEQARQYRLAHDASHDPLTGLPNRRAFFDAAQRRAGEVLRTGSGYGVLFVDVDGFKAVNDTAGHDAGDAVLQVVAERLLGVARPGDLLARLGGDEFAYLLEGPVTSEDLLTVGERARAALAEPVLVGGRLWRLGLSVGGALGREGPVTAVVQRADSALYRAKDGGKGRVVLADALSAVPAPREAEPEAPSGTHIVHLYERDEQLLSRLKAYVLEGAERGAATVVIATPEHRRELRSLLRPYGVGSWIAQGSFVEYDAAETLSRFMVAGMPDPDLFQKAVGSVVRQAVARRPLRAYGEMVALLWRDGNPSAALALEELWNDLQETVDFPLLCAYPLADLAPGGGDGIAQVCARHSHVVALGV